MAEEKLKIAYQAVDSLVPFAKNARTHTAAQIEMVARSIDEYGWTNPVLIDEDRGIIAGHARVLAAKMLGLEKIPTIQLGHMSEKQKRAYVIADNQLALKAGWDNEVLGAELADLSSSGFDMMLTGFTNADLNLVGFGGENDPSSEYTGMPQYNQEDKTAFRSVVVHFRTQEDVDAFSKLVNQTITEKTKYLWCPEAEIERYVDKVYDS